MYSKITKIGLFFLFICCCISNASAQTVQKIGDKHFNVTKSAVLELESTTKGFLPPRMTKDERNLIGTPAVGLVIYNTTISALEINTGTTVLPVWSSLKDYLPLAGGTMTGTVGVNGETLTLNTDTAVANTNTTTIGGGLGTGAITLGGTATQAINIGTGATGTSVKTVTIGSTVDASATTIQSGTGTLSLTPTGTGKIVIGNAAGTGDITLGSSSVAQTTNIGAGTGSVGVSTINIGTNIGGGTAGSDVNIGSVNTTVSYPSAVRIASGAGNNSVRIGTGGGSNTVEIGGPSGSSTTTIYSGKALKLVPDTGSSATVTIGNSGGSGTITLGSSSVAQTTNVGVATSTGVSTVNVGTGGSGNNVVTIGSATSQVGVGAAPVASAALAVTSATKGFLPPRLTNGQRLTLDGTSPASGLTIYNTDNKALEVNTGTPGTPVWTGLSNSYLPLAGGTMTNTAVIQGAPLKLNYDAGTNATTIGGGSTIGDITLGGTGIQAINIGTGTAAKTVTIGSTVDASATTIQSGTGTLNLTPAVTGPIVIGKSDGAGDITLGLSSAPQTTNVGTGAGASTVNVATGGGSNIVTIGGASGTSATTIKSGSAALTLTPAADIAGTIVIGNSAGLGPITLGSSSAAQTTNIGVATSTGISTVNVGTGGSGNNVVTIGSTTSQVGVGAAPVASAALAVTSTTKGFLPPRLTNSQRLTLNGTSPATGLTIYNTDNNALEVNTGTPGTPVWTGLSNSYLPLAGGTMTGVIQGSALKLNDGTTAANTTDIGIGGTIGTITLGGTATQAINIGTDATGTSVKTVTIGSTVDASATTIRSGTGTLSLTPTGIGPIVIGKSDGTGDITVGSSSGTQTTNIGIGAGLSKVNIAIGSNTKANLVTIGGSLSQVGVGAAPVASAALAVTSTNKGFLPPRMDNLGRSGIASPVAGLVVYNTEINALEVYTGTGWSSVGDYLPLAGGTMTGTVGISGTALNLNNNASTNATSIGGGSTTGDITLGGTGTQTINIGTGTGIKTVSLGSDASTSATTIKSGSGNLSLTPAVTGKIVIGSTDGTGDVTLGSSTDAQTTNVGTGEGASTVKIATGAAINKVTLGGSLSQIGVGGAPVTLAALAVTSTTKGFLPPRMTTVERDAIGTSKKVDKGMLIYNTTTNALEVNTADIADTAVWISVGAVSNPAIIAKTATYVLKSTDSTVLFTTSAPTTAELPTVTTALTGKIFFIRKDDNSTNTLTISSPGSVLKLSGVTTTVVLNYAKTIKVQCDGTNWIIID